ncbi:hypothetical protein M1D93_02015 [Arthrobacter sp. Z1-9]
MPAEQPTIVVCRGTPRSVPVAEVRSKGASILVRSGDAGGAAEERLEPRYLG